MSIGRVPGATGIQPSIVTAKGDLIVATASGSVTNQAVGSNNQVLMADSAQADGVKWANEATATLTTTGDILYASAANTPARLGIGSTSQVLTVSGGVPTWATPASGSTYSGVLLYCNSGQTANNNTWTVAANWAEQYDTDNYYNSGTSTTRITIPTGKSGKFLIQMQCQWADNPNGLRRLALTINGTRSTVYIARNRYLDLSSQSQQLNLVYSLNAGDYVEMSGFQGSGSNIEFIATEGSFFGVTYLGA